MSLLKIKNADGIFEDVLVLRGERGVGVKSIVQEGDHFLFTMTDGSVQTVVSPDCAEILQRAAGASGSAANAQTSEENAAASQKAAAASAVNAKGSADSAAASAENAKKSEDEAKAAAEGAAQSVLEKLNYNDETGTVELGEYAKKDYVDAGDTALKEFYDEPKEVAIKFSNRANYFTITENTFDDYGDFADMFPDCFMYADLMSSGRTAMTALVSDTYSWRMRFERWGEQPITPAITVTVNGEAIVTENLSLTEEAIWEGSTELQIGDILEITFSECDGSTCTFLYCSSFEAYKRITPKSLAEESMANKIFTLRAPWDYLKPPEGYEDFFAEHPLYKGFSCYVEVGEGYEWSDFSFYVGTYYGGTHTVKVTNFILDDANEYKTVLFEGGLCEFTYLGDNEWLVKSLEEGGARRDLTNVTDEVFKSKMQAATPTLLGYAEASDYGLDLSHGSFEVTYGKEYTEKGKSFIFTPTDVVHSGTAAARVTIYYAEIGGDSKSYYIKEYDSSGNLVDPTLVAGKPVLLVNNGTYLIAVR